MTTLAGVFLVLWLVTSAVSAAEGLKPRGSDGYRALCLLLEGAAVVLAGWVVWAAVAA